MGLRRRGELGRGGRGGRRRRRSGPNEGGDDYVKLLCCGLDGWSLELKQLPDRRLKGEQDWC